MVPASADAPPGPEEMQAEEEEFLRREIFQHRCYEPLQPLAAEPLIVDCGANVGLFALWALSEWPAARLICVEPLPPCLAMLRRRLGTDRALVVASALGATEETSEFQYFPWAPAESTRHAAEARDQRAKLRAAAAEAELPPRHFDEELQKSFQCRVLRLSTVLRAVKSRKGRPAPVDLLKVDVEGDEEAVLQGIDAEDWPRIRQVVAEVHDIDGRLERILALLQSHGFEVEVRQQLPCIAEGYLSFVPASLRLFHLRAARPTHRGAADTADSGPESKRQRSEQKQSGRALEVASAGWLASCMLMPLCQKGNLFGRYQLGGNPRVPEL
ncbi:unnamed protein product [Effrenium voratum]|nr:unnamed protein product [Effrenium voratum]